MSTTPDEAVLHDEDGFPTDLPTPGWDAEEPTPGAEEDDRHE